VALQIGSFEDKCPPTFRNLVHPNCGRGAGFYGTYFVGSHSFVYESLGNKVFILIFMPPVRDAVSGSDGRFLADKPISTELGGAFIYVSRGA